MAIDTSLYKLNKKAFDIIVDAEARLPEIASDAIDHLKSEKQPVLYAQLIKVNLFYRQLITHLTFNGGRTAIASIVGEDVSVVNKLLTNLKSVL